MFRIRSAAVLTLRAATLAFMVAASVCVPQLGFIPGLGVRTARATHFPWDQGHELFEPGGSEDCDDLDVSGLFSPRTGNARIPQTDGGPDWFKDYRNKIPLGLNRGPTDRTYNSQDARSGVYGDGWSSPLDDLVLETWDGVAIIIVCTIQVTPSEWPVESPPAPTAPDVTGGIRGAPSYDPPNVDVRVSKGPDGGFFVDDPKSGHYRTDRIGHISEFKDLYDNTTRVDRDDTEFPTQVTGPNGDGIELTRGPNGKVSEIRSGDDTSIRYGYDGSKLTSVTYPNGQSVRYGYDTRGRLDQVISPAGESVLQLAYDAGNRVTRFQWLDGPTWSVTYDSDRRTTVAEPSGRTWTYEYDETGRIARIQGPDGFDYRFAYEGNHLAAVDGRPRYGWATTRTTPSLGEADTSSPNAVTQERGTRKATIAVRPDGRRIEITSAAGRKTVLTRNAQQRIDGLMPPGIKPISIAYDPRGQVASLTQGDRTYRFDHDEHGRLTQTTDPLGHAIRRRYDGLGREVARQVGNGSEIGFGYDVWGNVTTLTPPGRPEHRFELNDQGLETAHVLPAVSGDTAREAAVYDTRGRITERTLADGRTIRFSYGAADTLTRIELPRGATTLAWDEDHEHVQTMTGADGERLAYEWDGQGRLRAEAWSGTVHARVQRAYDAENRLNSILVDHAPVPAASFEYDADDLITQSGPVQIERRPEDGRLVATTLRRVTTRRTHNEYGEPVALHASIGKKTLLSLTETRDALGRIATITEISRAGKTTLAYTYDAAGRLLAVTRNGQAWAQYEYDANGNRTAATLGKTRQTATYDARDRLVTVGKTLIEYDGAGFQRTVGPTAKTRLTYDALGMLESARLPGHTIDYVNDAEGRRIARKVDGVLRQGFLYADSHHPIAELDGAGKLRSFFYYGTRSNVPDAMVRNGRTYRILSDPRGSPRLVVDANTGAIAQRIDYGPFGRVLNDTNPGFQPFGFAGGIYDRDTGLVRFGARDYDPRTGRWTAMDPLGFGGGSENLYAYVFNDPVNAIDPTGMYVETLIDIVSFLLSLHDFMECPNLWNTLFLGLDIIGLALPLVGGLGIAGRAARGIDDVYEAGRGWRQVTSWAEAGVTPDLNPGRWVVLGEPSVFNFWRTGLPGPKWDWSHGFPWIRSSNVPFSNHITASVPESSLAWPRGKLEWFKGFFGQRILKK